MKSFPVQFVGAGPGDPELITVKGQKALAAAEVILYTGSLVPRELLQWAAPQAEAVDTATLDLPAIVGKMISAQQAGKRVVRLHTGDPSLFSALHEQIVELQKAGVPFEVIPGVTAASAAAATLAREFTLPEVTQTVILTRAAGRTPVPEKESLAELARHRATLVIYLSIHLIDAVVEALRPDYGAEAPVAVVYRASWPGERVVQGTLSTIGELVRQAGITRQALIIVTPTLDAAAVRPSKLYDPAFAHGYRS